MKKQLLSVMLLASSLAFSQTINDNIVQYDFVNQSLSNLVNPGTNDLTNPSGNSLAPALGIEGVINTAIDCNGNTSLVSTPFAGISTPINQLALSFWMKMNGSEMNGNTSQRIISLEDGTHIMHVQYNGTAGTPRLECRLTIDGVTKESRLPVGIFDNEWHHIAYSVEKNGASFDVTVYIDGNTTQFSDNVDLTASNANVNIFSTPNSTNLKVSPVSTNRYYGKIDNIRVYNRKLTQVDAQAITNMEVPRPGKRYVNKNATGANTGLTWGDAYTDLNDALLDAPKEIWMAKGTYVPDATDRTKSFLIAEDDTKIYGGFVGTEVNLSDRNAKKIHTDNATILSGDLDGNDNNSVTFNNPTRSENAHKIVKITANDIILDGLTISSAEGDISSTSGDYRYGSGISADRIGDFTLQNVVVKDNIAQWAAGVSYVPSLQDANLKIDACRFENNLSSVSGAGLYVFANSHKINAQITNSLFHANRTADNPNISTQKAAGGAAGHLRALYASGELGLRIINNTFVDNVNEGSSSSDFATLGLSRSGDGDFDDYYIYNNIFWGNKTNANAVALAIGKISDSAHISSLGYSIDEDGFSNISTATNTSDVNPNLTADFKLQASSTNAIDVGANGMMPSSITKDLAGNDRTYNTVIDIGAFEYDPTLSVQDITSNTTHSMNVYPNPVSETLYIEEGSTKLNNASMYNSSGQLVLKTTKTAINVSSLPAGMYIMQLENTNGDKTTKKIIKK